jgi:hypothetical protein
VVDYVLALLVWAIVFAVPTAIVIGLIARPVNRPQQQTRTGEQGAVRTPDQPG